jgi:hypothetical protein
MGFYHGSRRRGLSVGDVEPHITPREYVVLFADAMQTVLRRSLEHVGVDDPGSSDAASARIAALSRRLRQRPGDSVMHRMLAVVQAQAGDSTGAIRHLRIAVNILAAEALNGSSCASVRARIELARLLPVVAPLSVRRGNREGGSRLLDVVLRSVGGGG